MSHNMIKFESGSEGACVLDLNEVALLTRKGSQIQIVFKGNSTPNTLNFLTTEDAQIIETECFNYWGFERGKGSAA